VEALGPEHHLLSITVGSWAVLQHHWRHTLPPALAALAAAAAATLAAGVGNSSCQLLCGAADTGLILTAQQQKRKAREHVQHCF